MCVVRQVRRLPIVILLTIAASSFMAATVSGQATIRYVYDAGGRLTQVIQQDGTIIGFEYDALGNLLRRTTSAPSNPDGSISGVNPGSMDPASEALITIFGAGLSTATGVVFDAPEITGTIEGTPENNAIAIRVRTAATTAPGPHTFTVNRSALPALPSGAVTLSVIALPVLTTAAPTSFLTGNTIDPFTLTGARLDRSPTVVFDKPGLTLTNLTPSADGTSLTGRLQVALTAAAGVVGVRVMTTEGTTKKVTVSVSRSLPGLTGSYWAGVFALNGSGLPSVPSATPTFIRSDAALQFGTSTGFRYRPCFLGSIGCLNAAYTARWQGYVYLAAAGTYTFGLNSSDASQLLIDGNPVVSNPGTHGATTAVGPFVAPAPGSYPVLVLFNTSGATPGIDLLYQPPGASVLTIVPAGALWADGNSVYDPVLASAAAAVSVLNPAAAPSPGGSAPVAGATASVSFSNPAPVPAPGGAAPINAASAAVSFLSPAVVPSPGASAPVDAAGAAVSFLNPAPTPAPGGATPVAAAGAAVSFSSPEPVPAPGGAAPVGAASSSVGFAAGAVVDRVVPTQLSRAAGGGSLTLHGRNLHGATAVLFENAAGVSAAAPIVAADGLSLTTTVTIAGSATTGTVGLKVTTASGESAVTNKSVLEIVP